jgi:hypothetical protein
VREDGDNHRKRERERTMRELGRHVVWYVPRQMIQKTDHTMDATIADRTILAYRGGCVMAPAVCDEWGGKGTQ